MSWLPGQILDRNTAITAMILANIVGADAHKISVRAPALAALLGLRSRTRPDRTRGSSGRIGMTITWTVSAAGTGGRTGGSFALGVALMHD